MPLGVADAVVRDPVDVRRSNTSEFFFFFFFFLLRRFVLLRMGKWVRRHPTPTAMLAASLLLAMMLAGGSLWLAVQQAHRRDAVEADLNELAVAARERLAGRTARGPRSYGPRLGSKGAGRTTC